MSAAPNSLRTSQPRRTYRVVQWATGRIGASSLRELIRSPEMELVGVYVHSAAKDGRDAGELCGVAPVGVKATRDIQKIIALKPDCVVGNQEGVNLELVIAPPRRAGSRRASTRFVQGTQSGWLAAKASGHGVEP